MTARIARRFGFRQTTGGDQPVEFRGQRVVFVQYRDLAAAVKRLGRVGVSLGGHLQIVFGVAGERWLEREDWRRLYINESWTRIPDRYVPAGRTGENYW